MRKTQPGNSKFALASGSLNSYSDSITAELINKDTQHIFSFKLEAIEGSTFRILIDEKTPLRPRYKVVDALKDTPKPETYVFLMHDNFVFFLLIFSS